ncbi:hypothetical protein HUA74_43485 [Myxococcus sp. CA051A]|uniref:hypothetical protein n=1 Tax=Myxococcus sp. CA051A TaxID=2741739 RepID=UPI00157AC697|nr:hypothetical protein [Myxococcus sp. CA051A]NTX67534.1 hypothetical protein [Myxococcus sp. CA051A]
MTRISSSGGTPTRASQSDTSVAAAQPKPEVRKPAVTSQDSFSRPTQKGVERAAVAINPDEFVPGPTRRDVYNDLDVQKIRSQSNSLRSFSEGEAQPRTREDALANADRLLGGANFLKLSETAQGANITRDAKDVNDAADTDPASPRHQAAVAEVEANAALEQEALENLSPEERQQYEEVRDGLMAVEPAGDPVATLALQKLLLEGKLPGEEALGGEGDLLDQLHTLQTQELGEGIDRGALLSDVVQELATPESVNQRNKGTCAATAATIQLLMENPAEYVRLVAGLASSSGEVTLADGETVMKREALGAEAKGGEDVRSESQELLAPAFMEVANGDKDYQDKTDAHYEDGKKTHSGLYADEFDRLAEAVFDRKVDTVKGIGGAEEEAAAWELIQERTAAGESVAVGMTWGSGGHQVVVTGTGVDPKTGEEYVEYTNPWGRTERMPKDEFLSRLNSMHTRPEEKGKELDRDPRHPDAPDRIARTG